MAGRGGGCARAPDSAVAKPNAGIILVVLFSKDRQRLPEDSAVAPPPHGMGGIM